MGLAGAYDLPALQPQSLNLLGGPPASDPALWQRADVFAAAKERPAVPVLLVHGDRDDLVPLSMSQRLRDDLVRGGHRVQFEVARGADHQGVYSENIAGPLILEWLQLLDRGVTSGAPSATGP